MQERYNRDVPSAKGILFDLDGTLIDTLDDLADSMNAILRSYGYPEHPVDAYRQMVGWGMKELVIRALPEQVSDPGFIDDRVDEMIITYHENRVVKTRPYPGILELLTILKEHAIPTSIVTNKTDHIAQCLVRSLLDYSQFIVVHGAVPNKPQKPDPTIVLETAAAMDCRPSEVIYVGDSGVDMETAHAAGMVAVGVSWGFRSIEELRQAGARVIVHHPLQILDYVSI